MNFPFLGQHRWIATIDAGCLQIIRCHQTGGQNCMTANRDPGADKRARSNLRPLLHADGSCNEIKRRRFVIMIARAEKGALRNADVAGDSDRRQV